MRGNRPPNRHLTARRIASSLRGWLVVTGILVLVIVASPLPSWAANGDAAVDATRLLLRDGSSPKVEYVSSDKFGGIAKGDGTDPDTISAEFFFTQTGNGGFSLAVPEGAFYQSSGWKKNDAKRAEYRNTLAPAGPSPVRRASIVSGRRLKLSARDVGGFAFAGGDDTPVYTGYCVTNAGETVCHCSAFTDCSLKVTGNGTSLRCRKGGIDPGCRAVTDHKQAFTAQATSSFRDDRCDLIDDDIQDLIEAMIDLGYGVTTGHFEVAPTGAAQFAGPGQDALVSSFDDFGSVPSAALAPTAAVIFTHCTPSGNTVWSYQAAVEKIVLDPNDPDGIARRASLGEVTLNATNATTDGPGPSSEKLLAVWTADQQTFDDIATSLVSAGIDDRPANLIPIADLTVPDGNGGTVRTLTADPGVYPQAHVSLRILSVPPPDRTPFEFDRNTSYPFFVFYRTETDPRVPVDATKDPSSAAHADLDRASRGFDDLIKRVIRTFERDPFDFTLVSDQPFVRQNGVDSTLGIPVNLAEGGATCLADELDCGRDDADSYYAWPGDSILLGAQDYYVVVGLDYAQLPGLGGPMAGASRLLFQRGAAGSPPRFEDIPASGFDVSSTPLLALSNTDFDDLPRPVDATFTGGLSKRAREVVPSAFMVPFARPATCRADLPDLCIDTALVANGQPIALVSRLSQNPVTGTRPDPDQVVPWRLLHFQVTP